MFDTHVNLHGDAFEDDLQDILSRAREAGVSRMIAICDRLDNFETVHSIADANSDIWCSVGVHPHHSKDFSDLESKTLLELSAKKNVVAIGETGLDFHYNYSPRDAQIASFKKHIDAAQRSKLPLILHTREADEEMADILEQSYAAAPFAMLLHCYTGGQDLADRALALGAYVSVSGIFSFKSAKDVRAVIDTIPLDRILLETDCPYLAPMPMRGRRNEPSYLPHVAKALADSRNMDVDEVGRITEANALDFFSKVGEE